MVVVDNNVFTSSSSRYSYHPTNSTHKRFPSIPTIKEVPNRGAFNPTYHEKNAFKSSAKQSSNDNNSLGKTPTIVSTILSPTVTRRNSIQRKKRYMVSSREVKNHFFYPVKAPKRRRSKRGKFRNSVELDASLNYINIDSSMSKDLCLNQTVKAYELTTKEMIKIKPVLKETTKAITIDSKNNYIIYTPNPTLGKNSVISDAEQLLDQELLKLGTPITFNKSSTPVLPEYEIQRPYFNRYDTFPQAEPGFLHRTRSLPPRFKSKEGIEELWKLYLRRVIAARIRWRLEHMSSDHKPIIPPGMDQRRKSATSSVDTGYFMSTLLKHNTRIPQKFSSSNDSTDGSSDDEYEEPVTDEDDQNLELQAPQQQQHGESGGSGSDRGSRDSTQLVLGSLESLLDEMRSIIDH